jgi:hypothetical protein
MPLLPFGKERLDPHLALTERLLIRCGLLICPHLFPHGRMERPLDDATLGSSGAGMFHRTGGARGGIRPILDLLRLIFGTAPLEDLPLRTAIDTLLGIVGEPVGRIVGRVAIPFIKQRHVGTDAHGFEGADVLR